MNGCFLYFFPQNVRQNVSWFLSEHRKALFRRDFIWKSTEKTLGIINSPIRNF